MTKVSQFSYKQSFFQLTADLKSCDCLLASVFKTLKESDTMKQLHRVFGLPPVLRKEQAVRVHVS